MQHASQTNPAGARYRPHGHARDPTDGHAKWDRYRLEYQQIGDGWVGAHRAESRSAIAQTVQPRAKQKRDIVACKSAVQYAALTIALLRAMTNAIECDD
jgi:hypothetical protein